MSILALAVAACRSNELPPSDWPPQDFAVQVVEKVAGDGSAGSFTRSFRVWPDGLALVAESDAPLPGLDWGQPVYERLCVYRLDPRSTRTLGRVLQRTGLFADQARRAENSDREPGELTVAWTAFGNKGRTSLRTHDRAQVERVLAVVAGFLPDGVAFLGVEPDLVHVSDVPLPGGGVGAVQALREVARAHPRDFGVLLDLFALAVARREWPIAREVLVELRNDDARAALGDEAELRDWRREVLPKLEALIPVE